MPVSVGYVTSLTGAALVAAPGVAARSLGLAGQERAMRLVGVGDLVLVPGLLAGKPRWPWMAGRAGMSVAMAAYFLGVAGESRAARWTGVGLLALTAVDGATALALRRREMVRPAPLDRPLTP